MNIEQSLNAYKLIGDKCRLSEKTVRNAFAKKPVTLHTASLLSHALGFDTVMCFTIKQDNRGKKKSK